MSKAQTAIRRAALRTFYYVNPGDITIKHQWTRDPFMLHTFKHKGYWFHFADGQRDSLLMAASLLKPGDRVADVGGNIGYLTVIFSALVGPTGRVEVFEPSPDNLKYLCRNVASRANVEVFDCALSESVGQASFFVENLTGQNSSLVNDYAPLGRNAATSGISPRVREITVPTDTLDNRYAEADRLDFLKLDVEGGEVFVLRGATDVLRRLRPIVFLEISLDHDEILDLLKQNDYVLTTPTGAAARVDEEKANYFAFHRTQHAQLLDALGLGDEAS